MEKLIDILSHRREHGSAGEAAFVAKYLGEFDKILNEKGETLAYKVDLSEPQSKIKVLWSCHIDTMHRKNPDQIMQEVYVDTMTGTAFVEASSDCLGADDGAGVFLLLEMIQAKVPGVYVFHCGEEKGCIGSKQIADGYKDWLKNFTHAIAFDRRGTQSIITHQMGARGCSDELGTALALKLGMTHELDPTGVYTDTAQYMDIIPECVNISIGYESEHGSKETCDVGYVLALRDAICAVTDWELPVARDPENYEQYDYGYGNGWGWGKSRKSSTKLDSRQVADFETLMNSTPKAVQEYCKKARPETLAWTIEDLVQEVMYLQEQVEQLSYSGYEYDEDEYNQYYGLKAGMQ